MKTLEETDIDFTEVEHYRQQFIVMDKGQVLLSLAGGDFTIIDGILKGNRLGLYVNKSSSTDIRVNLLRTREELINSLIWCDVHHPEIDRLLENGSISTRARGAIVAALSFAPRKLSVDSIHHSKVQLMIVDYLLCGVYSEESVKKTGT